MLWECLKLALSLPSIGLSNELHRCYIWSIALYSSEACTQKLKQKYAENFETWCWRRMGKVKYPEKETNKEIKIKLIIIFISNFHLRPIQLVFFFHVDLSLLSCRQCYKSNEKLRETWCLKTSMKRLFNLQEESERF